MEKELLIEFVKWLRSEYQIEEVYEMFADEFLQDRAKVIAAQPDVIKSVCDHNSYTGIGFNIKDKMCLDCGQTFQ